MAEKNRLSTGARARFSLGGKKVGYAKNVRITEAIEYTPIECLDNIEVEEHVPIAYRVTFSASYYRIVGATVKSEGYMPKGGGSAEERLTNILTQGDLTATIEDTKTQKILQTVEQVKLSNRSITIDARGVTGEDAEFVCIRVKDESEVV